jgi:hypothetical protein
MVRFLMVFAGHNHARRAPVSGDCLGSPHFGQQSAANTPQPS